MAKPIFLIALLFFSSLATYATIIAHAFVLKPSSVAVIGTAKKGQYLWKAQRSVSLSQTMGAVRLSLSKDDCSDRKAECRYAVAFTTDSGETFTIDDRPEVSDFCGAGGVKTVAEDKQSVSLTCVTAKVDEKAAADAAAAAASSSDADAAVPTFIAYATKVFTFTAGSNAITVADGASSVVFKGPSPADFAPPTYSDPTPEETAAAEAAAKVTATSLFMGDTIAAFDGPTSKGVLARNAEVTLSNGTVLHGFYKSTDAGATFEYVSALPFPMGTESGLHVTGATKVMAIAGDSGNFKQAVSVFLGSRWEKVESVTYTSPLSTFTSDLGTTVYGGLRGKPGLVGMAAGRKRGTEKLVDFAALHNRVTTRMLAGEAYDVETGLAVVPEGTSVTETFFKNVPVGNFSTDFLNATEFECVEGGSTADVDGCATSSYVSVLPFGVNGSTVVAIYDKLANGYNPASGTLDGEQTLFAMKLFLNETKEMKEAEEKIREEERAEEKRKAAEEKRKQAQKEAEQREREKKRKKIRADKKKKREFRKNDKANIDREKAFLAALPPAKDGEAPEDVVIIRDVLNDFIEHERDTFFDAFGPDAEKIAAEEAKEEAEAEARRKAKKAKKEAAKKAAEEAAGTAAKEEKPAAEEPASDDEGSDKKDGAEEEKTE